MAAKRLEELQAQYDLTSSAGEQLARLLSLLSSASWAPTTVTSPELAVGVHVADSLSGLVLPELAGARRIADLGSGAGFPALVLAIALPDARIAAVESVRRKCDFIAEMVSALGIRNLDAIYARAEEWTDGREANDVICARAVAPLGVLLEYAAPLLRDGGALVAWKGGLEREELDSARAAAGILGFAAPETRAVHPFAAAERRQLVTAVKTGPTPERFPRRTGVALKRPLGA